MSDKPLNNNAGKEVLYIDVEDEITTIIEKLHSSKQKIVALVLPKRATVLQSIVNMKLLKRSADNSHKNIVLITSEAGILALAGTVGIHVARSLQSKPEIPEAPGKEPDHRETIEETVSDSTGNNRSGSSSRGGKESQDGEPGIDKNRPIGELAGAGLADQMGDDHIELDNDTESPVAKLGSKSKKGDKKIKIPNFKKFRLLIIIGSVAAVALIALIVVAAVVMPKATISIKTDSSAVNSSNVLALKTGAGVKLDTETGTVPATSQQTQKTATQQVAATGQQNNGQKATGQVTLSLKDCSVAQVTVPAGTGVVSNGLTFITQEAATLNSVTVGGVCKNSSHPEESTAEVNVVAQKAGTSYNLGAGTYSVSGFSSVTGSGTAMTGGTDDIKKIVTQSDIDSAKQKMSAADTDTVKQDLKSALVTKGLYAIDATFNTGNPEVKTSVNAGDVADNVTVTQTTTYSMLGVKKADLESVIGADVKGKIDSKKQKILDYGIDGATVGLQSQESNGATITYQTTVVIGSELDEESIKTQVAGKKAGEAKTMILKNPGVTDVEVDYSPFWVSSIPKKTSKIVINIEKPTVSKSSDASKP